MSETVSEYLRRMAEWVKGAEHLVPPSWQPRPAEIARNLMECAEEVKAMELALSVTTPKAGQEKNFDE